MTAPSVRWPLAAVAAALLFGSGAVACSESRGGGPARPECTPPVTVTAGKHRPPGGRSGGSRSRPRTNPKPAPAVIVPIHVDRSSCDD